MSPHPPESPTADASDSRIAAALAGRHIVVTGGTGFVGTALVERLLRCVPDVRLSLLVRPGRRSTVERRLEREVLRNDCFDRLRGELGPEGWAEAVSRVRAVAGDVGRDGLGLDEAGRAVLASADVLIHSAATVAFDSPLDSAVEINLLGPVRIVDTLNELGVTPHLVAVSTCYVGGNRRGPAPETQVEDNPFFINLDWRAEVDAARRTRADADAESRTPERLAGFGTQAREELGPAGGPILAERTEELRRAWVNDRLVEAGRARAASVGWPDVYAFTKALGEVAVRERRGAVPMSIVRPAIIESALAEPFPGWIRGFRMAEPIILGYARGLLREFPGVPEGVIDVIPVDLVVAAIVAAAAAGPADAPEPRIVQVASGSRRPLKYQQLVDEVRAWFTETPVLDERNQPIIVPEWRFPGRGRVSRDLGRAEKLLGAAERIVQNLPVRGATAQWGAKLEERKGMVERARTYVDLYGAYTECEAIYGVDNLLALQDTMSEADRALFAVDPAAIDWSHYISNVHLPSVVHHGRAKLKPGKPSESRSTRLRRQVLSPERHVAAFDLENTLIASNVVTSYAWLASRRLDRAERLRLAARLIAEAPSLLSQDRADRSDFLRSFYRRYEDAPVEQLREDAAELASDLLLTRSFPAAVRRVREHRALGHRTVLITGALDVIVEPLQPLFDDIICARLETEVDDHGVERLAGRLIDVPPTAEARAALLIDYCAAHGLDPAESVAYADSSSDLPLLEAVGFPVAVNPEPRLASMARKRGWLVEDFRKAEGFQPRLLPLAPEWRGTILKGAGR